MSSPDLIEALGRAHIEIHRVRSMAPQLRGRIVIGADTHDRLRALAETLIDDLPPYAPPPMIYGHPVDVDDRLPEDMVLVRFETVIA